MSAEARLHELHRDGTGGRGMTVEEVKELMRTFAGLGLTAFELELGDCKLTMTRRAAAEQAGAAPAAPAPAPAAPAEGPALKGDIVRSPIVGTYYDSSSPEAEPFVKVGSAVKKGDVLFIIESMKLMNEVTSEFDGTVAEILAHSGDPVEYGQPLMRIE